MCAEEASKSGLWEITTGDRGNEAVKNDLLHFLDALDKASKFSTDVFTSFYAISGTAFLDKGPLVCTYYF